MIALLGVLLLIVGEPQQPPLSPIEDFKPAVRQIMDTLSVAGESIQSKTTPIDNGELRQYAYIEKETRTKLDSKGQPKGTETNLYEVTRGPEEWQFYRKLISANGVPLPAVELAKQDIEQKRREQKQRDEVNHAIEEARKSAAKQSGNPKPTPTLTPEQQEKRRNDNSFSYYGSIYDIRIARREVIDGHTTVLVTFNPKANAKPKDGFLKMLQHLSVRGWVREHDQNLVRLEVDVVDTISFGLGLLAKFQEGSSLRFERRPVNDEIWAPVKIEATMKARVLLLKGINERQVSEYSDFKKYTVETQMKVIDGEVPQELAPSSGLSTTP
jgi:hypothetical protein